MKRDDSLELACADQENVWAADLLLPVFRRRATTDVFDYFTPSGTFTSLIAPTPPGFQFVNRM